MYGHETSIERRYKGFRIYGGAHSVHNESPRWFAVGQVFVDMPNGSLYGIDDCSDPSLAYEDEELAAWFGLGLAEIVVDHLVPPVEYYLTPMNPAWAVDLLRRRARGVDELPLVKLYEGMKYLEKSLDDRAWLVRRYRRTLEGDTRNEQDEKRKRRRLGLMALEIERVCVEQSSAR
jgi:hypothetical protein